MNISFSTICKKYASEYLNKIEYSFLTKEAKEYVLQNLGDLRVQDPMMYPSPNIEVHGENAIKHMDKIFELCSKTA